MRYIEYAASVATISTSVVDITAIARLFTKCAP
jgi:hypothetical protein